MTSFQYPSTACHEKGERVCHDCDGSFDVLEMKFCKGHSSGKTSCQKVSCDSCYLKHKKFWYYLTPSDYHDNLYLFCYECTVKIIQESRSGYGINLTSLFQLIDHYEKTNGEGSFALVDNGDPVEIDYCSKCVKPCFQDQLYYCENENKCGKSFCEECYQDSCVRKDWCLFDLHGMLYCRKCAVYVMNDAIGDDVKNLIISQHKEKLGSYQTNEENTYREEDDSDLCSACSNRYTMMSLVNCAGDDYHHNDCDKLYCLSCYKDRCREVSRDWFCHDCADIFDLKPAKVSPTKEKLGSYQTDEPPSTEQLTNQDDSDICSFCGTKCNMDDLTVCEGDHYLKNNCVECFCESCYYDQCSTVDGDWFCNDCADMIREINF